MIGKYDLHPRFFGKIREMPDGVATSRNSWPWRRRSVIGTVSRGAKAFYDQAKQVYEPLVLEEELEIVNCQGNVSLWEEHPLVHAHIPFARADGQTLSGHLIEGTVLFAGELVLREFLGPDRLRRMDAVTGLNLWVYL